MKEPVELLEERLDEIKEMIIKSEENNLLIIDVYPMKQLYNRYYVCIELLKNGVTFIKSDEYKKKKL